MNCKYMNMLRVVRGNAFKLKIAVEAYTPSGRRIDSFALGEAVLKLDKNGTLTTKEYTILEGTTILVAFDGSESLGVYGFQMSGEYEGEAWRWANAEIFQIVESNVKAHIPEGCVLLDDTYNMALKIVLSGGDGITFTPSVSEQGIISWTNDGGLPNPEPRNIRGPRGEQGPQGEVGPQGPRGQMGLRGQIGPKGDKGDKGDTGATPVLDVTASVDENVGNPMVVVESFGPAEHRTFDFQFKNLKGQKGETGATGPQGPQGQQGDPGNYTKPASGIPLSDLNGNVASGIVYDVTANNSGATFASLSALLSSGSLSTLIPTSVRKGGMTVKFVQSSDNKYVQYRLMSTAFSTNVAKWQGIDDKPTAGSENLVKSGGVAALGNKLGVVEKRTTTRAFDVMNSSFIQNGSIVMYKLKIINPEALPENQSMYFGRISGATVSSIIKLIALDSNYEAEGYLEVSGLSSSEKVCFAINDGSAVLWDLCYQVVEVEKEDFLFSINTLGLSKFEKRTNLVYMIINPSWLQNGVILNYQFQIVSQQIPDSITAYWGARNISTGAVERALGYISVDSTGHAQGSFTVNLDFSTYQLVFQINNGQSLCWDLYVSRSFYYISPTIQSQINDLETIADNTDYILNVNKTVTTRAYEVINPRWLKNGIVMDYDFQITSTIPSSVTAYFGKQNKSSAVIESLIRVINVNELGHSSGTLKIKDFDFNTYNLVLSINSGNSILWKLSVNKVNDYDLQQIIKLDVTNVQKSYIQKMKAFITAQSKNDDYGQATIIFDGDSILGSQLEAVESVAGDVKEQPYNLDKKICARLFHDKYQWNNGVVYRRLDHSDWTKSGFSNARTISSQTNPNAGSFDFNNVLTFYGSDGDYGQIIVNGYSFFKLVWSNYDTTKSWACNVTVSTDNGNTFVTPSSLGIGQDTIGKESGMSGNYDCACYTLNSIQSYIFRVTIASGASNVRFFGCEMWNGTRLNVIVEAASGTRAIDHSSYMKWYLYYTKFKPLLYIWDIYFFNDRSYIAAGAYTLQQYSDSLNELISLIKEQGIPMVALTPHQSSLDSDNETNKKITTYLLEMCESLRSEMAFVDIRNYFDDNKLNVASYCSDGIHLNTAGNALYFQLLDALFG